MAGGAQGGEWAVEGPDLIVPSDRAAAGFYVRSCFFSLCQGSVLNLHCYPSPQKIKKTKKKKKK
jgi:hypothetical protein